MPGYYTQRDVLERPHKRKIESIQPTEKSNGRTDIKFTFYEDGDLPSTLTLFDNGSKCKFKHSRETLKTAFGSETSVWVDKEVSIHLGNGDTLWVGPANIPEANDIPHSEYRKLSDALEELCLVPCGAFGKPKKDLLDATPEEERKYPLWKKNWKGEWLAYNEKIPEGFRWQERPISGKAADRWISYLNPDRPRQIGWMPHFVGMGVIDLDTKDSGLPEGVEHTDENLNATGEDYLKETLAVLAEIGAKPLCVMPSRSPGSYHIVVRANRPAPIGKWKYGEFRCGSRDDKVGKQAVLWYPKILLDSLPNLESCEPIDWDQFILKMPPAGAKVTKSKSGKVNVASTTGWLKVDTIKDLKESLIERFPSQPGTRHASGMSAINRAFHELGITDEVKAALLEGLSEGPWGKEAGYTQSDFDKNIKDAEQNVRKQPRCKNKDCERTAGGSGICRHCASQLLTSDGVEGHPDFDPNSEKHEERRKKKGKPKIEGVDTPLRHSKTLEMFFNGNPQEEIEQHHIGLGEDNRIYIWDEENKVWSTSKKDLHIRNAIRKMCNRLENDILSYPSNYVSGLLTWVTAKAVEFPIAFNVNPDVMGLAEGKVVELPTGTIRDARHDDFITMRANYVPEDRPTPIWDDFLDVICKGDDEKIAWLRKWLGFALTGHTKPAIACLLMGDGGNGKGTLINVIEKIMGTYSIALQQDMLKPDGGKQRHLTLIAELNRKRLFTLEEAPRKKWNTELFNKIVAGGSTRAHFMQQDAFDVSLNGKLIAGINEIPKMDSDSSVERRLGIVPVPDKIENPDPEMEEKLMTEASGILHELVVEASAWYMDRQALADVTDEMNEAKKLWLDESKGDEESWIDDRCLLGVNYLTPTKTLFEDYEQYCEESGVAKVKRMTKIRFSKWLVKEGFQKGGAKNRPHFEGIGLASQPVQGVVDQNAENVAQGPTG